MRVIVLGAAYEVVRVAMPDGVEGEHRPTEATLCVSEHVAPARRWSVLRHELGHAAFWEGGCRTTLKASGLTEQQAEDVEEIVMDNFVAVFCDALERMGWLQVPEIR